jgi:Protein of unknown function (DUF3046)
MAKPISRDRSARLAHGDRKVDVVRITEFWSRMEQRFGAAYAGSVAADYRLPRLGATVNEALAAGVEAKQVWRAVCEEFEMPASLR